MKEPSHVCVAGIGGYARAHHQALRELESQGLVKVLAACDPALERVRDVTEALSFETRGIQTFTDFNAMLKAFSESDEKPDWASVAAPIPFHAAMHQACVEAGIACYLEKPPTLDPAELEAMIERDHKARVSTQVGFNHIVQAGRLNLKQRIINDDFGQLRSVSFFGAWQRSESYFKRSPWAGRLMHDNQLLLDSCLGNAMSHHVHNLLFFCGKDALFSWAECETMEAELYRANPIESADTLFLRGQIAEGITFRFGLTHACFGEDQTVETLEFDRATVTIQPLHGINIAWNNGRTEFISLPPTFPLASNFERFLAYLAGDASRVMTRLVDCRPFVRLNAMAYLACEQIHSISDNCLSLLKKDDSKQHVCFIPGIIKNLQSFLESGRFPSETDCPWAAPGGSATPADLVHLSSHVHQLIENSKHPTPSRISSLA